MTEHEPNTPEQADFHELQQGFEQFIRTAPFKSSRVSDLSHTFRSYVNHAGKLNTVAMQETAARQPNLPIQERTEAKRRFFTEINRLVKKLGLSEEVLKAHLNAYIVDHPELRAEDRDLDVNQSVWWALNRLSWNW